MKMDILCTSWVFLCCSLWVGLPPALLSPPHPLLSAQSHHSSTSMHFCSGHNGDHMLKRALKPNPGHPPSNKPAVSSAAGLCLRGTKPYLRLPCQHAIQRKPADNTTRLDHMFCRFLEVSGTVHFWLLFPLWGVQDECPRLRQPCKAITELQHTES